MELPTYAFQRRRYWVEPKSKLDIPNVWWSAPTATTRNFDRGQWTYLPSWQLQPRQLTDLDERLREAGPWLVFTDDARGEAVLAQLRGCRRHGDRGPSRCGVRGGRVRRCHDPARRAGRI